MSDPGQLMSSGQGATSMGTWMSAAGQFMQGISGYFASMFQAGVAANNARLALQNEHAALQAGERAETTSKMKTSLLTGAMEVGSAANNIETGSGSALTSRLGAKALGAMDALTIRYNAARQAYGYGVEAEAFHEQRNLDRWSAYGSLASAFTGSWASYISGSTALESQSLSAQQAGITGY